MPQPVRVIAEAGVNHNGSLEVAKRLVEVAAEAGADFVKFQTFRADALVTRSAPKAAYQERLTEPGESQGEMLRKLELDEAAHRELLEHCRKAGIRFLSTAFDFPSIALLQRLGMDTWKVPSGEITNLPMLRTIGGLGQEVILSTGMSTLEEVRAAHGVLVAAGTAPERISILHCTTEYPADVADVNLRVLDLLARTFPSSPIGYSDHTEGIEVSLAAVALGAAVLEKHFTLDRGMPGPDHQASLEPGELVDLVRGIRKVSLALGTSEKKPSAAELRNRDVARKSIVAARAIRKGEAFSAENLAVKRPGTGLSPMRWDEVLGRPSPRDYGQDELIHAP